MLFAHEGGCQVIPLRRFLLIRVSGPDPGAAHLYLLDFVPDNLPELKETIRQRYPDVKVSVLVIGSGRNIS